VISNHAQHVAVLDVHLFTESALLFLDASHSAIQSVAQPINPVRQTIVAALV